MAQVFGIGNYKTMNNLGIQSGTTPVMKLNVPNPPITQATTTPVAPVSPEPQTPEELDPDVVRIAKSIRQVETGNRPVKPMEGDVGGASRYQFTYGTWKQYAKQYLGDENAPLTEENENKVAYKKIKEWKDDGYNIGQVASMWNAGEGRPNAYVENWRKVDPATGKVIFDTPAYAEKVAKEYQKLKEEEMKEAAKIQFPSPSYQTQPALIPQNQAPVEPVAPGEETLGQQLKGRLQDIKKTWQDTASGAINPASTGLQTIGAGLGMAGDVANAVLEKVPLVGPALKGIEKIIGKGTQAFLETDAGQSVAQSLNNFAKKHPELSKDLGAGLNIASALPILKGFGTVKNAVLDASARGLKGWAENTVKKDLYQAVNKTLSGRNFMAKNPETISTLIKEQAIPDISREGNALRYSTKEQFENLGQKISNIEDNELQPLLRSLNTTGVDNRVPLEAVRKDALANIKSEFKTGGNVKKAEAEVNRIFDDYQSSYGDYTTLEDINDMKRGIRQSVNFSSPKLDSDVSYHVSKVFQKTIENSAKKLKLDDVHAINQSMANLIKAQDLLKILNGKTVSQGLIGKTIKTTAVGVGESLGRATGIPMAGALGAYQGGNIIANKVGGGLAQSILKRTANPTLNVKGKLGGALGAAILQKQTQK